MKQIQMNEFDIINTYFTRLTEGRAEALNLRDDGAILNLPDGHELVITSDTLNEGTHFLASATPQEIAHKALRVNLSDLAAMGAKPLAYQLNIAFPEKPTKEWLTDFTDALLADQKDFEVFCSGGDTTSIKGPLSITITMMGTTPKGKAIQRNGAQDGDIIYLSGPVGDAFIGLKALRDELDNCFNANVIHAYTKPLPRLDLIALLQKHAHAAIDISDGLIQDLGHICQVSGCAAHMTLMPDIFSKSAHKLIELGQITAEDLLTGGDDYQLLIAIPESEKDQVLQDDIPVIEIGRFIKGSPAVHVFDPQGKELAIKKTGWSHF